MTHTFRQVDVFAEEPVRGNPLAVVHDADDLTDEQMAAFAAWTNLSETTFLLRPTDPAADYRVRIFTGSGELPFAGHPTLGSAHAWVEAGGAPRNADAVVQECGVGLVEVRRDAGRLAFAAPDLLRSGAADKATVAAAAAALRIDVADVVAAEWIDNGPGWLGVLLADAEAVLAVEPDVVAMGDLKLGLAGPYPSGSPHAIEVRALFDGVEDPVTGSLNAGLAQWLIGSGRLPEAYTASQGTRLGRSGRVHVQRVDGTVWVGGATRTVIHGALDLG